MNNIKKEMVYYENENFPYKMGYSLGTVYTIENDKYKLHNFGFCPSVNDYYFNLSIHVPRKIQKVMKSLEVNDTNSLLLEELYGVLDKNKVEVMINGDITKEELKTKVYIKK